RQQADHEPADRPPGGLLEAGLAPAGEEVEVEPQEEDQRGDQRCPRRERLEALLRPGEGIDTVITADTYGAGEADVLLGRALAGVPRDRYSLAGAVGHDFYEGKRDGAKGFPRFTDPRLRGP